MTTELESIDVVQRLHVQGKNPRNRLLSIALDAKFVDRVLELYNTFQTVVNERCGSWYVRPEHQPWSAYFKSTDGHTNQWSFSTRRLNLHLLDAFRDKDGLVIVDSTRRGKRTPDALSKTIPIWIATINKCVFERIRHTHESRSLCFFPPYLPKQEIAEIEKRLDGFVDTLIASGVDLKRLSDALQKPMRPLWFTPASSLSRAEFNDYYTVVLVTASEQVQSGYSREHGFLYVQGAADDEEEWACHLTPSLYWKHQEQLLAADEDDLSKIIAQIVQASDKQQHVSASTLSLLHQVQRTKLWLGDISSLNAASVPPSTIIVNFAKDALNVKGEYHYPVSSGKMGALNFKKAAKEMLNDLYSRYSIWSSADAIFIVDAVDAKEAAPSFALLLLCVMFSPSFESLEAPLELSQTRLQLDKTIIRNRLIKIIESSPKTNPSRAFLIAVNTLLLSA
ncbi:initiator methionine tRNA 2'-O-ribosyl phosphate transferase [Schizosaccharomyces japonicus yFS275]|uniref:Initiator methionine tRNA 2'-O-ribosyl phosphate transferase n=1 Tax=Schizosaccharomyces japonicus (strain yFS275 / FY16936) TaxID=402676 RepID=B6K0F6_SCHJY|nr:initiator methionine tRNA 2'-O-ribosyl phosphate transferase [Schizosaccharomyces japonicus yFS275]EEB06306.1 initiator methionine tRNA 2'-O-ribosyl phosphate transferase [Schizosaccharomyces japonicus yFS275]